MTAILFALFLLAPQPDAERIWKEFLAWFENGYTTGDPQQQYRAKLAASGMSPAEIDRAAELVRRFAIERPEGQRLWFNRVYAAPKPMFRTEPNALLAATIGGLKPGAALDVAMGQGRNSVFLATRGWQVTGFDPADRGLEKARAAAEQAGVKIQAVQAGHQQFDFGDRRWDLIVMTYAFVPITDAAFVARIRQSLRPGGLVVFEHFRHTPGEPGPGDLERKAFGMAGPGEVRQAFAEGFRILSYEEPVDTSEWGPRKATLVRMVAERI